VGLPCVIMTRSPPVSVIVAYDIGTPHCDLLSVAMVGCVHCVALFFSKHNIESRISSRAWSIDSTGMSCKTQFVNDRKDAPRCSYFQMISAFILSSQALCVAFSSFAMIAVVRRCQRCDASVWK
jgi:hypothetical protein